MVFIGHLYMDHGLHVSLCVCVMLCMCQDMHKYWCDYGWYACVWCACVTVFMCYSVHVSCCAYVLTCLCYGVHASWCARLYAMVFIGHVYMGHGLHVSWCAHVRVYMFHAVHLSGCTWAMVYMYHSVHMCHAVLLLWYTCIMACMYPGEKALSVLV